MVTTNNVFWFIVDRLGGQIVMPEYEQPKERLVEIRNTIIMAFIYKQRPLGLILYKWK